MKNITITVTEDVARWAKVYAAKHDTSVSRIVGELLRDKMESETAYTKAMEAFLAKEPKPLKEAGKNYPSRESLHER